MLNLIIALLTIYNWLAVGLLILCLLLIARFYQKKSRQKSYYQIYLLPLGLFTATGFYYAGQTPELVGHPEADMLRFLGGLILVITSYKLLMLMIGK